MKTGSGIQNVNREGFTDRLHGNHMIILSFLQNKETSLKTHRITYTRPSNHSQHPPQYADIRLTQSLIALLRDEKRKNALQAYIPVSVRRVIQPLHNFMNFDENFRM
jgi:hypothetical protein